MSENILKARSSALSPGAIAGISIGTIVVVALLIGISILFWRRQKKRKQIERRNSEEKAIVSIERGLQERGQVKGSPQTRSYPTEIDGERVHEVEVQSERFYEADHTNTRAELQSEWRGWEAPALSETEIFRSPPGNSGLRSNGRGPNIVPENSVHELPADRMVRH